MDFESQDVIDRIRDIIEDRVDIQDDREFFQQLYEHFLSEMPYDVAKSRSTDRRWGSADEWINCKLEEMFG